MNNHEIHSVTRDQVLYFRLNSQNLAARLAPGSLLLAARVCGFQNTPPGTAELSLHARIAGLTPGEVKRALEDDRSLLQVWSMRASPYVVPTADAAVFTLGLLPVDEESLRFFIFGVKAALEKIGISAVQTAGLAAAALKEELDGRAMTKDELGIALARWVALRLPDDQRAVWEMSSWYAPGQSLGESVIRFFLPVLALQGLCCHAERRGIKAYLRRTGQWIAGSSIEETPDQARAELVRRYLHGYGPSTPAHFSAWAGIAPAQAARSWDLLAGELVEISLEGRKIWLLQCDLEQLLKAEQPAGIRFLPPHDPYLQLRDRETLIPQKSLHPHLWRHVGSPGVVLWEGQCVASWRSQKKGKRLLITVEPFTSLSPEIRAQVAIEAAGLAPYKDCTLVETAFTN